jgi:hypothetical protein
LNDDEDGHRHIKGQRAYESIRAQDKEIYEDEYELSDYISYIVFPKSTSKIDVRKKQLLLVIKL